MPIYPIGHQLTILETVDSSNNYAMGQLQEQKAVHGQVYFALEQTAGKGQMGKQWISEPAANIMASIVLETRQLAHSDQFYLSMAMALGCRHWFSEYAGEETRVKWPNDLYWRDRKAGGILIENKWLGPEWQFAVVGIGINMNQTSFLETPKKAVSLRQITGRKMDLLQELRLLCQSLDYRWQQLSNGQHKEIHRDYLLHLFGRDKLCRMRKNNIVFETRILGVTETGELQTRDSLDRQFKVGEVEWL